MEESLRKFMPESTKRHDEKSNLIKEIRASKDVVIRHQEASIKSLKIQIEEINKVLQERGSGSLLGSIKTNPRDHVKSISTAVEANTTLIRRIGLGELAPTRLIIELADRTIKRPKGITENILVGIDKFVFPVDFIILDMPEDIKVPLILRRPFLSTAHAKIDVFKKKIYLRVGDDNIVFKSDNPTSNIIKRVYMLGLRERMELDLEARLMGEALILNRSLDPKYGDYIKLNDLDEPYELGEIKRNDDDEIKGIDEYPSFCDFDMKIHIDFVENMDAYRDQDMGEVIVGEPFYREICVKARRFDGIITIYNGNDSVTYQIARSHPRFKTPT
nr:hypothetical protein [Tanacetum cinerariifolium]